MEKRVYLITAIVSGTPAVSDCTASPYTGEREAGKPVIGAGLGSLVGAGISVLSSSKKDRDKGVLIDVIVDATLDGGASYYMNMQETKLHDRMRGTGISVTRSGDNTILNMPNNVIFDNSSAALKPASANTLTGVVMALKEYPRTAVSVIGYTDSTGDHGLDMCLSWQRADSVVSALITWGVDASRIRTQGFGPANPIANNGAAEGKT